MLDTYLQFPEIYLFLSFAAFVFGANMGSFLNVCIWRIPRGESIVHPPSQCPKCHNRLKPWHNIPIIGWLSLRGKCAFCKTPISARYIIMEVVTGLLYLSSWIYVTQNKMPLEYVLFYWALCSLLLVASMIDFDLQIIPDKITKFGIGVGLIACTLFPIFQSVGATTPYLPFQGQIIVRSLIRFFSIPLPDIAWLQSGFNSLIGAILGFFIINCIIEIGKVVYGKKHYKSIDGESTSFTLNQTTLTIGNDLFTHNDLFMRARDVAELHIVSGSVTLQKEEEKSELQLTDKLVTFSENHITIDDEKWAMSDLISATGNIKAWSMPQEVMGYGDAKLLALCGAFLGPEAIIFILTISSTIGTLVLVPMQFFGKNTETRTFPFGPFIGIAAYLWVHFGNQFFSFSP